MRSITRMATLAVLAAPLLAFSSSARADNNDFLNQAQRFFNNGGDRDAYERGREDEVRRQEAERDRRGWHREDDRVWSGYDRDRDDRYRDPSYR
jgi:hypothetical protein